MKYGEMLQLLHPWLPSDPKAHHKKQRPQQGGDCIEEPYVEVDVDDEDENGRVALKRSLVADRTPTYMYIYNIYIIYIYYIYTHIYIIYIYNMI